jgi:hypothetical protein
MDMDHSILNDDEQSTWKVQARSGRLVDSIKTLRTLYYLGYADAKVIYDWYVLVHKLKGRTIPDAAPVSKPTYDDALVRDLINAAEDAKFQLKRFNVIHGDKASGPALDHLTAALYQLRR